jgi:hypothetical protein
MIPDLDIYRTANVLIGQSGGRALLEAMYRLELYRAIGNEKGASVWRRIADAIEALQMPAHLSAGAVH